MKPNSPAMRVFHVRPRHGENVFVSDDGTGVYGVRSKVGQRLHPIQRDTGAPADLLAHYEGATIEPCELGTGEHYVRIFRPPLAPLVGKHYKREWANTVQSVRSLLAGLRDAFRVVEPVPSNLQVYGHQLRQLLILACNEVESSCRAVLKANGYAKPTDSMTMSDYAVLAGPMHLGEWEVSLSNHPDLPPFRPFESWNAAEPKRLPWYQKQHGVKHNREELFSDATLENAIHALGAAFVLVHAQFGHFGRASFNHQEIDDFSVRTRPTWALSEHYVAPPIDGIVHGEWKGTKYPLVVPEKPTKAKGAPRRR